MHLPVKRMVSAVKRLVEISKRHNCIKKQTGFHAGFRSEGAQTPLAHMEFVLD